MKHLTDSRDYIQKFIDLYCDRTFNVPEDINSDNLKKFLIIMLKHYEYYHFTALELKELAESISIYFCSAYCDENNELGFPEYSENDNRNLSLTMLLEIKSSHHILPEDVSFLIRCLNLPDDKVVDINNIIDNYFNQFDIMKRCNEELPRRETILKKLRLEALENNEPLPIRPMGIKLDPCYIPKLNKLELLELIKKLYNTEENNFELEFSKATRTLLNHNIMTIDLRYHLREKKLSPEEILIKVQPKSAAVSQENSCISDELMDQIMSEPIVVNYNWESGDRSELHPIDKKYYLSLGSVGQWLQRRRLCKILSTLDPQDIPNYDDYKKISIIARKYKLPWFDIMNWIKSR